MVGIVLRDGIRNTGCMWTEGGSVELCNTRLMSLNKGLQNTKDIQTVSSRAHSTLLNVLSKMKNEYRV